jgi:hypothetical protein
MSFDYGPNYMSMVKAIQEGGTSTLEAVRGASDTRGPTTNSLISRLGEKIEGPSSPEQAILGRFNKVKKDNETLKEQLKALGIEQDPVTSELNLTERLYGKLGGGTEKIVSQSYFNLPIVDRPLKGNSRKAGDISKESQQKIIKKLIDTGRQSDMSNREIAIMLASVRHESGFNPDAAARGSSASGLAQFINDTGTSYGINNDNRWDVDMQVQATVDIFNQHFIDIETNNYGEDYVYALHHDGPSLSSGGLKLSKDKVMPFVNDYEKMLENY